MACVAVATFIAWRPVLSSFFQMDDFHHLLAVQHGTFLERLREHTVGFFTGGGDTYWRPGWHALIDLGYALGGMEPERWFWLVLALHELVALGLLVVLLQEGAPTGLAVVGTIALVVAPGYAEGVAWISAALNVLPCALLVLLTGRAILQWLQGARGPWLLAAFLLFVYSLAFKEAAYHVPLLFIAGVLVLGRSRTRSLGSVAVATALFGAVIVAHYFLANRVAANALSAEDRFTTARHYFRDYLVAMSGISGGTALLTAIGVAWGVLLVTGSARTRFFLAWAPLATFPYVFRAYAPRFALFFHLPLAAGIVLWLADRVRGRGRVVGALALLPLGALAAWNVASLRTVQQEVIGRGDQCRNAVESLRHADLAGVRTFAVDNTPPALLNALAPMLELYANHGGGPPPAVRVLGLFVRPPFVLHRDPDFGSDEAGVAFFHCEAGSCKLERTTREALVGRNVALPMYALRHQAVVVADAAIALRQIAAHQVDLARTVVLAAEPVPPFQSTPGATGTVRILGVPEPNLADLEVESSADGFLALHVYGDLARTGSTVEVDGAPAPLLAADALFNAVRIPAGKHHVRLIVRGNPLRPPSADAAK